MRILFVSRRLLVNLSLLAVLVGLVGAMKLLSGNEAVVQWVSAGLNNNEPPLFMAGNPQNQAVSLLVQLDDTVEPAAVGQLLQILADNSAKATFFVSGQLAEAQPQLLQSILAGGHQIGNFGYDDTSPANLTLAENRAALERASACIAAACGERPLLYLPPFGVTEDDIRRAAAEAGLVFVLGGVDSGDWQGAAPEEIIAAVLPQAQAGSFITISVNENTLAALNTLLQEIAALDLRFITVSENLGNNTAPSAVTQNTALTDDTDSKTGDNLAEDAAIRVAGGGINLNEPKISAKAALLLDAETGQVLWQQNGWQPMPPASTTKILTALLCLDIAPLDREVEVSAQAAAVGESSAGLLRGERFELGELLNAALLKSANDACFAIAEGVAGSEPYFVHLMNVKAAVCGAPTVQVCNTNGLPAEQHRFSCYDLALLTREAMQRPEFKSRVGSQYGMMQGGSYNRSLKNTNRLLTMDEHVTGVKTGTTNAAGACLVSAMERDGRSVIAVVLHSNDRYNDSLRLLNYGIDNFTNVQLVQAGQQLACFVTPAGADGEGIWLAAAQDIYLSLPADQPQAEAAGLQTEFHFKQLAEARLMQGVAAGEVLGTLEFYSPGAQNECLVRVNLLAAADWQPGRADKLAAGQHLAAEQLNWLGRNLFG